MKDRIKKLSERIIILKKSNVTKNAKECLICNWKGEKFLDYVRKYGRTNKNIICPKCGSHPRHRMLYFLLKKTLPRTKKIKLLHFAPEKCISNLFKYYKNIEYLTADINEKDVMIKENIENLSFEDCSFDIIICSHVLEHVENDKKAIEEMYRVLKYNGTAIIIVPINLNNNETYENQDIICEEEREKQFGQIDHLRLYGKDFKERVEEFGFKLTEKISAKDFDNGNVLRFGLKKDVIFVFKKH